MSTGQQVIKVLAIIFAIFIIVNVVGGVIFGISLFAEITMIGEQRTDKSTTKEFSQIYENKVDTIKVETAVSKLTIQKGTRLKVEGSNLPSKFTSKVSGTTLTVKEEGNKKWLNENVTSEIIITIPEGKTLTKLEIDSGVGTNHIQDLTVETLDLDCGVGTMQINNVTVLSKTKINGGAGRTVVEDCEFEKLDLDSGVGEMVISADLTGNSKIDSGVGRLSLNLLRSEKDYTIKTQSGLGRMTLNGKKCTDNGIYGSGNEEIKIDGGVGVIEITTLEN